MKAFVDEKEGEDKADGDDVEGEVSSHRSTCNLEGANHDDGSQHNQCHEDVGTYDFLLSLLSHSERPREKDLSSALPY